MSTVDRTRLPSVGHDPPFRLPEFQRTVLANGTRLWAAEHRRAPVLTVLLLVPSGAAADPLGAPGLAALTADLLDEGSTSRSGIELHEALTRLGGHLTTEVWSDATVVGLTTLSRHLRGGLELLFELVTQPRFDPDDVARVRDLRLNRILQMRQSPSAVADRVFLETLYDAHPYGHLAVGTEAALSTMSADDAAEFHRRWYTPSAWTLIAVGDVPPQQMCAEIEQVWAEVSAGAGHPAVDAPLPEPSPAGDRMVFVARDGAVQSEIRLGHPGVPRSSPDYYALRVLNAVLGGQFVSRVNLNLREDKGYTYGARTSFDWRTGRGPFSLQASVQTAATIDGIREAVREMTDIRGARPPTADELALARAALTRGFPRSFETASQIAGAGVQLALHQLSDDTYAQFVPRIMAVGADDVLQAALRHLHPEELVAVVVGSRPDVLGGLAGLGFGEPVERPNTS
jgi:predicted Zn-dependent peptidase